MAETMYSGILKFEKQYDGIYIVIDNPMQVTSYALRDNVMGLISKYKISNVDFAAIDLALSSTDKSINRKITIGSSFVSKDEKIDFEISKDKLSLSIKFSGGENMGKVLDKDDVMLALRNAGIVYGVDEAKVEDAISQKVFGKSYLVGTGLEPARGKDGLLEFHFDISKKTLKPKVLEGGKVDYRDVDLFEMARAEQVLITVHQPTPGTDGKNIFGESIPFQPGKLPPILPRGKNVKISEDGLQLISEINGQVSLVSNKVSVNPILEIQGSVDNSTGNVQFIGSVIVRGNVISGFSIVASGDLDVYGAVEGASIYCDGNIVLHSGVQGAGKANIVAGGFIKAKYIENSTIVANGDVFADSIMHSDVRCGGDLTLAGKRGFLIGGKFKVRNKITAMTIGSSMATVTELEVGLNPELLERYRNLIGEFNSLKSEMNKMEQIIDMLSKANEANKLDDTKRNILLKSIHTKAFMRDKIDNIQKEINIILPQLEVKSGSVAASNIIYAGVKVLIGNAMMYVREEIQYCKLININGEIKINPFA